MTGFKPGDKFPTDFKKFMVWACLHISVALCAYVPPLFGGPGAPVCHGRDGVTVVQCDRNPNRR